MVLPIIMEVTDFYIHNILKFKQYINTNIANFGYNGKLCSLFWTLSLLFIKVKIDELPFYM